MVKGNELVKAERGKGFGVWGEVEGFRGEGEGVETERRKGRERGTDGFKGARGGDEGDGEVGVVVVENGGETDEGVDVALSKEGEKNYVWGWGWW